MNSSDLGFLVLVIIAFFATIAAVVTLALAPVVGLWAAVGIGVGALAVFLLFGWLAVREWMRGGE